jgi:hypothetical protein
MKDFIFAGWRMLKFAPGMDRPPYSFLHRQNLNCKGAKDSAKDAKRLRRNPGRFTVVKILSRGMNADYIDVREAEVLNAALGA